MTIKTDFYFERGDSDLKAVISGDVTRHFRRLEIANFESNIELSALEREEAEDKLMEVAPYHGHIPEEEPEARRYGR